jgi:hypothetical protein
MGINKDFFGEADKSVSYQKKPSYTEFCKTASKAEIKRGHLITTIWLPGKWDNFSLDTLKFRVRVSPGNDLYDALKKFTEMLPGSNVGVQIFINQENPDKFKLVPTDVTGEWEDKSGKGFSYST